MRLLLAAHDNVGLQITKWLIQNYKADLSAVITKGDNPILELCRANKVWANYKQKEIPPCDLGILAWWPDIIKEGILKFPRHGWINTHPSLLPFCRGKHYNFWTIVEERKFGVTLHVVEKTIDTGAIIAQEEIPYTWEDTGETLYYKAQSAMVNLFIKTYPRLRNLDFWWVEQKKEDATLHHSREIEAASQLFLNSSYNGRHLLNLLRARTFLGHPACWFMEDGVKYEVRVDIRKINE